MQEMQEMRAWSLTQEDPLERGMATHSSILAWEIPWTEEPGGVVQKSLSQGSSVIQTYVWELLDSYDKKNCQGALTFLY